jgi:hypothetical protein
LVYSGLERPKSHHEEKKPADLGLSGPTADR